MTGDAHIDRGRGYVGILFISFSSPAFTLPLIHACLPFWPLIRSSRFSHVSVYYSSHSQHSTCHFPNLTFFLGSSLLSLAWLSRVNVTRCCRLSIAELFAHFQVPHNIYTSTVLHVLQEREAVALLQTSHPPKGHI